MSLNLSACLAVLFQPVILRMNRLISSKDAYMLVYARRGHGDGCMTCQPPTAALEVVNGLNAKHEMTCEEYEQR